MGHVLVVKGVMDWTSDAMAIGRLSARGDDAIRFSRRHHDENEIKKQVSYDSLD